MVPCQWPDIQVGSLGVGWYTSRSSSYTCFRHVCFRGRHECTRLQVMPGGSRCAGGGGGSSNTWLRPSRHCQPGLRQGPAAGAAGPGPGSQSRVRHGHLAESEQRLLQVGRTWRRLTCPPPGRARRRRCQWSVTRGPAAGLGRGRRRAPPRRRTRRSDAPECEHGQSASGRRLMRQRSGRAAAIKDQCFQYLKSWGATVVGRPGGVPGLAGLVLLQRGDSIIQFGLIMNAIWMHFV